MLGSFWNQLGQGLAHIYISSRLLRKLEVQTLRSLKHYSAFGVQPRIVPTGTHFRTGSTRSPTWAAPCIVGCEPEEGLLVILQGGFFLLIRPKNDFIARRLYNRQNLYQEGGLALGRSATVEAVMRNRTSIFGMQLKWQRHKKHHDARNNQQISLPWRCQNLHLLAFGRVT